MRSSYRKIGDFIKQVKVKNKEGLYDELLGINIDKFFMPSVANTVGVDLTKYKVVEKGQFACNRMHVGRDERIPVALSDKDTPFIVSPAYDVFEIEDTSVLLPEYLMMWLRRKEFDRNAWFYTDADVRGGLPWSSFCEIELPIPSIEKQRAIVAEYNTVVNRIQLNEQLNQKLEETAQAIYKQWFVDFEFPNEDGEPYKASGGKMVYNEELDKEIPEGWEVRTLEEAVDLGRGSSPRPIVEYISDEGTPWIKIADATKSFNQFLLETKEYIIDEGVPKSRLLEPGTLILANSGSLGTFQILNIQACAHDGWHIFHDFKLVTRQYITLFLQVNERDILTSAYGSVFTNLKLDFLKEYLTVIPSEEVMDEFTKIVTKIEQQQLLLAKEVRLNNQFKHMLLSKMTKVEETTEKEINIIN